MNILVTGAKGFIGRNLVATLQNIQQKKDRSFEFENDITIFEYDVDTDEALLDLYCKNTDFIFHLAGVNRPQNREEFKMGNCDFTEKVLALLRKYHKQCPIVLSSSIQAELDNDYGKSKRMAEDFIFSYAKEMCVPVYVYRFPNVFGKWCRPNYNSVVATFCYNIANELPIQINDPNTEMTLVYIDDLISELLAALSGTKVIGSDGFCKVDVCHKVKLGKIAELLYEFQQSRETKYIPDMTEGSFSKKLYATYLSYLPRDAFSYPLKMNVDERGSFTELLKTEDRGQVSVNISKPGITKGEHWHHTKNEKFIVVSGKALIQFRKIDEDEMIEYHVSGDKIEVVDIPTGYTHNIINEGDGDLVTVMWCNECFNPKKPDTYSLKVVE